MKSISSPAVLTTLFLSGIPGAFADERTESIEKMQAQIEELQRQLHMLQTQMEAQQKGAKAAAPVTSDGVKISFDGGPTIKSADGEYSMHIGGRVKFDATFFDDDRGDYADGTEIRSARLHVKGKLGKNWSYKLQNEFLGKHDTSSDTTPASYDSKLKSAYIAYEGFDHTKIIMGQTKQPFGLEYQTSSRFTTFLERASLTAFTPGYGIGLGVATHGDNWTLTGGLYGEDVADSGDNDESYSVTARATYAPISEKTRALHFGIAGSYRVPGSDSDYVKFKSTPEAHQAGNDYAVYGSMKHVDDYSLFGLESAWVSGPFSLQGEYMVADINRDSASDPTFDGYYVQASYFLTGESRNYLGKYGKFGRLTPQNPFSLGGGAGAWEVAARYSNLDLNDSSVNGGEMRNWTFGLNWYPTPYFRLMANYILVDTDSNAVTPNDDPDIFAIRTQVDF